MMRPPRYAGAALIAVGIGCGRSALDAPGGTGAYDGDGLPVGAANDGSVVGDDTSAVGMFVAERDVSSVGYDETGAFGSQFDAQGAEADMLGEGGDGAPTDALPSLACLDRPTIDCDCTSDVCGSRDSRLAAAIRAQSCGLACLYNYFTFDGNGCVTGYTHGQDPLVDDACVLRALGAVRFSCTEGVSQPFRIYYSCTVAM